MLAKRNSRLILAVLTALLMALSLSSLAWAGGWAVVTLDRLPENVTAGQPYALGFMVRQHGRTPLQMDKISIQARQVESKQSLTFTALPDEVMGHYQAELIFPEPGAWEWSIQSGLFPQGQPMPVLQVAAAGVVAGEAAPALASAPAADTLLGTIPGSLLGVLALLCLAAGVILLVRGSATRLRTLAGAGLLVLCGALAFAFFSSMNAAARPAQAAPAEDAASEAVPEASTGQALFLAKGCVVCHVNTRATENAAEYSVQAGPNLSTYRNDPKFLHSLLKDPGSVRPGIEMPNLELKEAEINALVAFLNSD